MNIIVVAKNKETFFSWIKENTRCLSFNKKYGEAHHGATTYLYAGHNPERLRGLRAEAFVVIECIAEKMLSQVRFCCDPLLKDDFGKNASKTYKEFLFEE